MFENDKLQKMFENNNSNLDNILKKLQTHTIQKLCVICTKNPTNILLNTISNIKQFYPNFDIVIIDSDSNNFTIFQKISNDIKIEFIKNKNLELGAWYYAFNKYNMYDIYMFIQDSTVPIKKIEFDYNNIINTNYFYSFHFTESMNYDHNLNYKHLYNTLYEDTDLKFISDMKNKNKNILCAAHNSFITNRYITKQILKLEQIYIDKNILNRSKIDAWLAERTIGIIADKYSKKRINITPYFKKYSLKRDY